VAGSAEIETMALTAFQIRILKLLAARRKRFGESYIAGGLALNTVLENPRLSKDIDIFHDTQEALQKTWDVDRKTLADVMQILSNR
jgi:hypothetical protein